MEQKHIVLAGAGMMGASLSQVYAQAGYQVSLWNGSESGLERAKNLIALNQETLRKEGSSLKNYRNGSHTPPPRSAWRTAI